ncbi:MAG: hypothetical protein ACLSE4_04010 [Clostridium sp.]
MRVICMLKYCYHVGVRTYSVPKISDVLLRSSDELNLFDTPLLLSRNIGLNVEQQWMKRVRGHCGCVSYAAACFRLYFVIAAIGIKSTDHGPDVL